MIRVKSKIWLEKDGRLIFGSGRFRILQAIDRCGSINRAAAELGISYRRVWDLLQKTEKRLKKNLLIRVKGGRRGGGAFLTPYARKLMAEYALLEKKIRKITDGCSAGIG